MQEALEALEPHLATARATLIASYNSAAAQIGPAAVAAYEQVETVWLPAMNRTLVEDVMPTLATARRAIDEAVDTLLAAPSVSATAAAIDSSLGYAGAARLIFHASIAVVALWLVSWVVCLPCRMLPRRKNANGKAAVKRAPKANKPAQSAGKKAARKDGVVRVRMCKFCEVEVKREHEAAHLSGKKHQKLAGKVAASACFEWVEKRVEGDDAAAADNSEPMLAPSTADGSEDGWETVTAATKKKEARAAAAARRAKASAEQAQAAAASSQPPPRQLRVHRRCDECGIRVRDGATIETDPDNENRAYCVECWDRWRNPVAEAPAAEAPEVRKHVTKWNR